MDLRPPAASPAVLCRPPPPRLQAENPTLTQSSSAQGLFGCFEAPPQLGVPESSTADRAWRALPHSCAWSSLCRGSPSATPAQTFCVFPDGQPSKDDKSELIYCPCFGVSLFQKCRTVFSSTSLWNPGFAPPRGCWVSPHQRDGSGLSPGPRGVPVVVCALSACPPPLPESFQQYHSAAAPLGGGKKNNRTLDSCFLLQKTFINLRRGTAQPRALVGTWEGKPQRSAVFKQDQARGSVPDVGRGITTLGSGG